MVIVAMNIMNKYESRNKNKKDKKIFKIKEDFFVTYRIYILQE